MKPRIGNVTVTMTGNQITRSKLTGINMQGGKSSEPDAPDENAKILRELRKARKQLEETEPLLADAVAALETAVRKKDEPKITKLLDGFAKGTAKAALVKVASDALLSWMKLK